MQRSTREIAIELIVELITENIEDYVEDSEKEGLYEKYLDVISQFTQCDLERITAEVRRGVFSSASFGRTLKKKEKLLEELEQTAKAEEERKKKKNETVVK